MTFLYPNPVLQMKHSFWRINLYAICRSYRSRCKRCEQRWSFLAEWKRLMLQKGFSHSFWCTRDTWSFFVSNSVCFRGKENALLFCHNWQLFFSKQLSYLRPIFFELVHRKTFVLPTDCCFWKKDLQIKAERRRNHWRLKRVLFQRTFWTSPRKTRKFRRYCIFSLLINEISRKNFQLISVKWKQSSFSQKKH